jgi:hypothetical protein
LSSVKVDCLSFEWKSKRQARAKGVDCLRSELSVQIRKVFAAYNSEGMGAFLFEWGVVDFLYFIKNFNGAGKVLFRPSRKIAQARA